MGVVMGTPYFMLQQLEREKGLQVRSSQYELYQDMSDRMMSIISRYTPEQDVYSIDECFTRFTGMNHMNLFETGKTIRQQILQCIGIPTCVGIAQTKTLAKMANRFAKKMHRKVGVYFANTEATKMEMLEWCSIDDVWGIGHQYSLMLQSHGFKTAADLLKAPEDFIRSKMTVQGLRLVKELKGIPSIEWQAERKPKQNICTSRSFGELLSSKQLITEAVATYSASCAEKLRREGSVCGKVHVFINTNPHRADLEQYYHSINVKLLEAANDTPSIIKAAVKGLNLIWKDDLLYMKAGVVVQDLKPQGSQQTALFVPNNKPRLNAAMAALDGVNKRYGRHTVQVATQGQTKAFQMRQDHLSKSFTTCIDDVIEILD